MGGMEVFLQPERWLAKEFERFQTEDGQLEIIPHTGEVVPDSYLFQIYRRIVRERTVYKTFYDGSVQNTRDFVDFVKSDKNKFFIVNYRGKEAGFFWLTEFVAKTAFINYCLFNEFWGKEGWKISNKCLDIILNQKDKHDEHKIDVLLGLTPATNKLAMKFLVKNGMKVIGRVPKLVFDYNEGAKVDGVLAYKGRDVDSKITFPDFFPFH
jgi:hypothetical protein